MGTVHRIVLPGARSLRIEPSTMIPGAVRVQVFAEQGREAIDMHLETDTARVFEVALQAARVQSGAAKLAKLGEALKTANSGNVADDWAVSCDVAGMPEKLRKASRGEPGRIGQVAAGVE